MVYVTWISISISNMQYKIRNDELGHVTWPILACAGSYIDNKAGTAAQSLSFTASDSYTETKSFTHTAGLSITVGTEFKCGVPAIAEAKVSVEITASYEFT